MKRRTTMVMNEELVCEAMVVTGAKTMSDALAIGLQLLIDDARAGRAFFRAQRSTKRKVRARR